MLALTDLVLRLEVWFVHDALLLSLLDQKEAAALKRSLISAESHPMRTAARSLAIETSLARFLTQHSVPSVAEEVLRNTVEHGKLVWLEQAIAFRNPRQSRGGRRTNTRASFSLKLNTDNSIRVEGAYSLSRLTTDTAHYELSGIKRHFILGYVEDLAEGLIIIRPVVIANRWYRGSNESDDFLLPDRLHLWPSQVDQFSVVDFESRLSQKDLNQLQDLPEASVKQAFADIIGEPDVPKDWGGEQFDLWTTNLRVNRQRMRAAIMFKGPAIFRPMTIAHLGKNGDQIDRLASTAADVMVVQHSHKITAPVHNMLRMYAENATRPRHYMLIDGYDTIRILRHFGFL